MKKYLIFSIVCTMIALAAAANVSAASISSQSVDVTVGEVDQINTNDENLDARTPDTGLFGLNVDSASIITSAFLAIPAAVILAYLFRYIHRKHTK